MEKKPTFTTFEIVTESHPLRADVEHYIAERYRIAFDATVTEFMPYFSCALDEEGSILSVCGFRTANNERLFLEQYLHLPAEQLISQHFGARVERSALIEFGQLASFSRGVSLQHFTYLSRYLVEQGFSWCIFTATGPLQAMMKRFGLAPVSLVDADSACIDNAESVWGSYYQTQPKVSAGSLVAGAKQLSQIDLRASNAHLASNTPMYKTGLGVSHG
ncbi:thermostable hemolysin [Enterovibrio sp. 27052020O]|uniref:thermostable hemolysin n=1 Tax=Enterovibrio sp. 27052020O TaxID=3241166 RepID=UPI00388FC134